MTADAGAHRRHAAEYDRKAITARNRVESAAYRRLARAHRLKALMTATGVKL